MASPAAGSSTRPHIVLVQKLMQSHDNTILQLNTVTHMSSMP